MPAALALGRLGTSLGAGRAYGGNCAGYSQLSEHVDRTTGPPIENWVDGDMLGVRPSSACWGAVKSRQEETSSGVGGQMLHQQETTGQGLHL